MPKVRPLLNAAMAAHLGGVATKVLRDGTLRFNGDGYGLTVRSAVLEGAFPRLEFFASAHLDHVGEILARALHREGPQRQDISLHFGHREMFSSWGPAYARSLSSRDPALLEVMGDDYVGLHVMHLRAILEGEVLPLTRRLAQPAAYDALLNDAPEAPVPFLHATQRAARGIAVRHLLGGRGLAELIARYEESLADTLPLVRVEFDRVRDFLAASSARR